MSTKYQIGDTVLGSWEITEKLDQGSSGQLFQIHKKDALGNDTYSALKIISIPSNGNAEIKALLSGGLAEEDLDDYYQGVIDVASNEFTILSRLKGSNNIVSYEDHEIIKHEGSFGWDIFIRMEQITSLVDYSLDHELTEDDVLRMGMDICRGLELCSRHNIIHRDIKPANIFVSENGDFKIGDFGIARINERTQTYLSRKGTFTYMAPEVFCGDPYTENVDLYSLGLVMYQYLNNGRGPFLPEHPKQMVYEDSEKAFAMRMSGGEMSAPANGSPRLKEIVLKACAYDSSDRYASASEMLDDLEELSMVSKQAVRREKSLQKLPRRRRSLYRFWYAKKKQLIAVLAAVLICAAAFSLFYFRGVTDIKGIDDNTDLLINETISPEYSVEPFLFKSSDIAFSSSDEKVFTVDKNGAITATGTGEAILTMKCRSYVGYARINVDPKVTKIGNVSDLDIYTGNSKTLKPRLLPEKYAGEKVSYASSDSSVAKINSKGRITALKEGTSIITITAGGKERSIVVTVQDKPEPVESYETDRSYSSGSGSSDQQQSSSSGSSSVSSSGKSSGGSGNSGSDDSEGKDYFGDDEFF